MLKNILAVIGAVTVAAVAYVAFSDHVIVKIEPDKKYPEDPLAEAEAAATAKDDDNDEDDEDDEPESKVEEVKIQDDSAETE